MAQSHFDRLTDKKIEVLKQALLTADASNSHFIAKLQGRVAGLEESKVTFREATHADIDEDAA